MFFKRRIPGVDCFDFQEIYKLARSGIPNKLVELETRVKQLECNHTYVFKGYTETIFGPMVIEYKCNNCGKLKLTSWHSLPKKEQRALKTLNLIPKDWPITAKGGE